MTAPPAVAVRDLAYAYGDRQALAGVSFTVEPGEILGLLGPNGSGKTTLFRILATLLCPQGGQAEVFGADVSRDPLAVRRLTGIVFQSQSLDRKLTVRENLVQQGHLYGISGPALRARVQDLLEEKGLAERAGDTVETLSGGLARRVELAKSLVHSPTLLLMDEPTAGLDPGARIDLWERLQELALPGKVACLLTTHLMEEAERCHRVVILESGRIVAMGTPDALKSEIGGDVIVCEVEGDPEAFREEARRALDVEPQLVGSTVRIEKKNGHEFVRNLFEAFPGRIRSVTFRKPTLEDVFVHKTGHRFRGGQT